jgi:tRNA A37 methylthiotransferase MiaB
MIFLFQDFKLGVCNSLYLCQNVNSYRDTSESIHYAEPINHKVTANADGFKTIYKAKVGGRRFADLLEKVSQIDPEIRLRFTSPHPKVFLFFFHFYSFRYFDMLCI